MAPLAPVGEVQRMGLVETPRSTEPSHTESSMHDPATRRLGTVLDGKWTLERLLGVGGMAAVYAANHRNGAQAAIKLFPFSITTSPESAERILREGHLANRIGHSAVVRVLDDHLDREREYAYLVMELLDGETARQRIERLGPMTPLDAVDLLIDLADCLAAAHAKGVVHRDIKPENLFITADGQLKVLDFGVARAMDGSSSFITRTGATLGTPAYMSPEQARGRSSEISPRTDIYSAGATLLFLVSGEFLHEGENAQEIMVRAAWTPARKVASRDFGLPDCIVQLIDKACEFEPSDRFESAEILKAALLSARTELEVSPAGSIAAPRPARISQAPPLSKPYSVPTSVAADATIAEDTRGQTENSTLKTKWAGRRAPLWVLAALAFAMLARVTVFRPRPAPQSPSTVQVKPEAEMRNAPPAPSSAMTVPVPPPAVATSAAAPPPVPPLKGPSQGGSVRRPTASSSKSREASAAKERSISAAREPAHPVSTARDVGY